MPIHTEINSENDICEHLCAAGWLHAEGDAANYGRGLALFPADTISWVKQCDPLAAVTGKSEVRVSNNERVGK